MASLPPRSAVVALKRGTIWLKRLIGYFFLCCDRAVEWFSTAQDEAERHWKERQRKRKEQT